MHGYQFATPRAILHIGWYWTIHHAARHRHIAHPPLTPQMLLPTWTRCAAASQHDALRQGRNGEERIPAEGARITAERSTRYRKWNASIIRGAANCVLVLLTIAGSPLTRRVFPFTSCLSLLPLSDSNAIRLRARIRHLRRRAVERASKDSCPFKSLFDHRRMIAEREAFF